MHSSTLVRILAPAVLWKAEHCESHMEIEREIREFVIDNFLFGQPDELFLDTDSFLEKGLIDSMGILTLVEFVRDRYRIAIEDEELIPENWDSVQRIARFIQSKFNSQTPSTGLASAAASGELLTHENNG